MLRDTPKNNTMLGKISAIADRFDADADIVKAIKLANADVDDDWCGTKIINWKDGEVGRCYSLSWKISYGTILDIAARVTEKIAGVDVETEQKFFHLNVDKGQPRH